jgi:outer membrane protein OmpA-like peptidoglycan-associated protein
LVLAGIASSAHAQSNEVIVNYDVLNALPPSPPEYPQAGAAMPNYGTLPQASGGQLAPPPSGELSSVLTMIGPDGRPVAPIKLKRPGTQESESTQVASTPPEQPPQLPEAVTMPAATPPAPAPGVNTGTPAPAATVQTSEPTAPTIQAPAASNAEPPAPAAPVVAAPTPAPAQEQATQQAQEQPAQEQPAPQQQAAAEPAPPPAPVPAAPAAQQPAAEQQAATTPPPPAEGDAAKTEPTEQKPAEEAAAPPEPDNAQPAPPVPQGGIRIVYPTDANDVPPEANAALDDLASQMQADENMRIEIRCYGSGTPDTENKARRKSLARCLSIRQYLFNKDIRTTRMDVRALGLKSEGQPADRVDIVPATS